jgi:hypothetical protein
MERRNDGGQVETRPRPRGYLQIRPPLPMQRVMHDHEHPSTMQRSGHPTATQDDGHPSDMEDKLVERYLGPMDRAVTRWMARAGVPILRVGMGVVFFWFGILKLFPGLSPAEDLVRNTVYFVPPEVFIPVLAVWETLIGLGLITGQFMRLTLLLLFLQMPGTALPLVLLP